MKKVIFVILFCIISSLKSYEAPTKIIVKYYNFYGHELWRMNEWVAYNTELNTLSVYKKGFFELSRTKMDSLEADAIRKYKQFSIY